ncbi:hypothetical protein CSOJ01_05646 [Colletotrichum sojae]|uniref:Uncharacterized protein n=1 Tax=Colletotrichum sojae TaxID=2175907 RepID=A0A8H6JEK2_9PEZI|nr:hypothetical protein CSOJ01_05646 [Colletotrichum sojae]
MFRAEETPFRRVMGLALLPVGISDQVLPSIAGTWGEDFEGRAGKKGDHTILSSNSETFGRDVWSRIRRRLSSAAGLLRRPLGE